jgi:hypothetical protein
MDSKKMEELANEAEKDIEILKAKITKTIDKTNKIV